MWGAAAPPPPPPMSFPMSAAGENFLGVFAPPLIEGGQTQNPGGHTATHPRRGTNLGYSGSTTRGLNTRFTRSPASDASGYQERIWVAR